MYRDQGATVIVNQEADQINGGPRNRVLSSDNAVPHVDGLENIDH